LVVVTDGSGYLSFRARHCPQCLTRPCGDTTRYQHQVLEAKLLGPAHTVLSIGTAFIENEDLADTPAAAGAEQRKQDCELKAARRLWAQVRQEFPHLRLCWSGDALYACGTAFQLAQDHRLDFVFTFKEGRLPNLWTEFQALLPLCPQQQVTLETPAGVRQVYRWINDLSYTDSQGRTWPLAAIQCTETVPDQPPSVWAWLTKGPVDRDNVVAIATMGGRYRWHIENQGFNTQKTSDLNLEHAYSRGPQWKSYYYLLQIAHLLLQLLEKGSLLRQLAAAAGRPSAVALFGSLKNMAERLRESLRFTIWPAAVFDAAAAAAIQIRFDNSS
jgi:hypothetical protein